MVINPISLTLVSWNIPCKPKDCGSLGIRPHHLLKKAVISKMGMRLLHDPTVRDLEFYMHAMGGPNMV